MQASSLFRAVGQAALEALLGAGAGKLLMLGEAHLVVGGVNGQAALGSQLDGELQGEAVGVVQVEGVLAVNLAALGNGVHDFVGQLGALVNGLGEGVNLLGELLDDEVMVFAQLGVVLLVNANENLGILQKLAEGNFQLHAVAHGAADDAAQHVALVHVGGGHGAVVAQQEGGGTHMVTNEADAVFRVLLGGGIVDAGGFLDTLDDGEEQLGVVHALEAVQHAQHALQAQAGVNVVAAQGHVGAFVGLAVLHEHVVPDFQVLAAGAGRLAIGAAGLLAGVEEDLSVGTAGAGGAGGTPPVFPAGVEVDALVGVAQAAPGVGGNVVAGDAFFALKDGDGNPVLGNLQHLGEELMAEGDGLLLEVVVQGPVAHHLEEGQVAGVANLVDVAGA